MDKIQKVIDALASLGLSIAILTAMLFGGSVLAMLVWRWFWWVISLATQTTNMLP